MALSKAAGICENQLESGKLAVIVQPSWNISNDMEYDKLNKILENQNKYHNPVGVWQPNVCNIKDHMDYG